MAAIVPFFSKEKNHNQLKTERPEKLLCFITTMRKTMQGLQRLA